MPRQQQNNRIAVRELTDAHSTQRLGETLWVDVLSRTLDDIVPCTCIQTVETEHSRIRVRWHSTCTGKDNQAEER